MPANAIKQIAVTAFGQAVSGIGWAVGESVAITFACEDPQTRLPLDLTGGNVTMAICAADVYGRPVQPPVIPPGGGRQAVIANPLTGVAVVSFNPSDTVPSGVPITPGVYPFDLFTTDSAGNRRQTIAYGVVTIGAAAVLPATPVIPLPSTDPLALGPPGVNWRGLWSSIVQYAPRDGVQYADPNGGSDAALSSFIVPGTPPVLGVAPLNGSGALNTGWAYLAERGAAIVWKGTYNNSAAYVPNDVVSKDDGSGGTSSYICILATTGHTPPNATYWALLASGQDPNTGLPPFDTTGAVIIQDTNSSAIFRHLTEDDILPGFSISSFAGAGSYAATKECGDSIVNPSFTAAYSSPVTSATHNDGAGAVAVTLPATSMQYNGGGSGLPARTYTRTAIAAVVTWLLTVIKGVTKTASVSATWLPRVFYDVAVPGTFNAVFIAALTGQTLASGFTRTIAFGVGGGTKKLYYAIPTAFGDPATFKDHVTGFAIPTSKVASAVAVTNGFGVTINYDLWQSDNFTIAAVTEDVA